MKALVRLGFPRDEQGVGLGVSSSEEDAQLM